jgi:hypothetical protein
MDKIEKHVFKVVLVVILLGLVVSILVFGLDGSPAPGPVKSQILASLARYCERINNSGH